MTFILSFVAIRSICSERYYLHDFRFQKSPQFMVKSQPSTRHFCLRRRKGSGGLARSEACGKSAVSSRASHSPLPHCRAESTHPSSGYETGEMSYFLFVGQVFFISETSMRYSDLSLFCRHRL